MPNIRPIPEDLQEIARSQLNEDPKTLDNDLAHIKDWLSTQPHITARMDDQFLVAFLRRCKYNLEHTKEKLDLYYTLRAALGIYFNDRDPMRPEIQRILDLGVIVPLPEPDDLGRKVLMFRQGVTEPNEFKINDLMKVYIMLLDYMLMNDDKFIIAGAVLVQDMNNVTLEHVAPITPTMMKQSMKYTQEGFPMRPKGMHLIGATSTFEGLLNILKALLSDKLKKRLHVHGDGLDSLHKYVPQRIFPKEYGGAAGPIDDIARNCKKEVESFRDWFLEDTKYKVDETKRPGGPKKFEDLFGVEESFGHLSID